MRLACLVNLDMRVAVDERGALGQHGPLVHAVVEAGAVDVAVREEELAAGLLACGTIRGERGRGVEDGGVCLLYTSDAADE